MLCNLSILVASIGYECSVSCVCMHPYLRYYATAKGVCLELESGSYDCGAFLLIG